MRNFRLSEQIGPIIIVAVVLGFSVYATGTFAGYIFAGTAVVAIALIGTAITLVVTQLVRNQASEALDELRAQPNSPEVWERARDRLLGLPVAEQKAVFRGVRGGFGRGSEVFLDDSRLEFRHRVGRALGVMVSREAFSDLRAVPHSSDLRNRFVEFLLHWPISDQVSLIMDGSEVRDIPPDEIEEIFANPELDPRERILRALWRIVPPDRSG